MTDRQLRKLARIFAANIIFNSSRCHDSSELLNEHEHELFIKYVNQIIYKMLQQGNAPTEALFIGKLDKLIEFVQK